MKKGFSIIELIIVIGIIAILASITVPTISKTSPTYQLSGTSKELIANLRLAQEDAVSSQKQHLIKFSLESLPQSYQLIKRDGTDTVLETQEINSNISISIDDAFQDDEVVFSADGAPSSAGIITLNQESQSKSIDISPAGVIRVQ